MSEIVGWEEGWDEGLVESRGGPSVARGAGGAEGGEGERGLKKGVGASYS